HSPRGGQVVLRTEGDGTKVRFEVSDQGAGIPPEYRDRIFEKFFRIPGTKGEGIGLGLYISREIVRAHGGEMGVDSQPGHGARFWFTLPVPDPAKQPRLAGCPPSGLVLLLLPPQRAGVDAEHARRLLLHRVPQQDAQDVLALDLLHGVVATQHGRADSVRRDTVRE